MKINLDMAGHKKSPQRRNRALELEVNQLFVQKDEIIGTKGHFISIPLDEDKGQKKANGE